MNNLEHIEFRYWDTINRKYVVSINSTTPYIIEKNTGLKDKDGLYIYENDVWQRDKPVYRNGRVWINCPGREGTLLVFHIGTQWSIQEEEDCESTDGYIIGTIHDIDNI